MARAADWTMAQNRRATTPALSGVSLHWVITSCLTLSFLFSFTQYEVSYGVAQYGHIVAFGLCGVIVLCGRRRAQRMQNIMGGGAVLMAAVLFGEAISYTSGDTFSTAYGLIFIMIILSARLIVQEIGMAGVVRAYSQAAIISVGIMTIASRSSIFGGSRFTGGTRAHPNLIAFFLGGYFPVIVWRALEEKTPRKKWFFTALSFTTFLLIFFTGSRGTLLGVLVAVLAVVLRGAASAGWLQRIRIRHVHLILTMTLVPLLIFYLARHNRVGHIADYLTNALALNSSQRGLKSGFSGRTFIWNITFGILRARNRWLFGFGYRAGDRLVGTIDNGYIQLLFESGLISGSMILGSMIRVFLLLWRASKIRENNAWTRYYLMLWSSMVVYFINNFSARYLFSFGSSFSLLVICMMVSSRRELVGGPARSRTEARTPAQRSAGSRLAREAATG